MDLSSVLYHKTLFCLDIPCMGTFGYPVAMNHGVFFATERSERGKRHYIICKMLFPDQNNRILILALAFSDTLFS